ncbi:hypothetical protein [Engelhardtia mirabilis]|uniref:Uncharacterized protein n=1 Tax=Engelhardtia mirabilis TaxID=2528011 RepID=A0A518BPX4_9BACT|nr:hypothetical protein Pla133_41410 [Planctomycetes bacterium Pla133]QDV03352.1 hypothetical protein Pla86_41400 [Planctomycetes bacterium Pla86]
MKIRTLGIGGLRSGRGGAVILALVAAAGVSLVLVIVGGERGRVRSEQGTGRGDPASGGAVSVPADGARGARLSALDGEAVPARAPSGADAGHDAPAAGAAEDFAPPPWELIDVEISDELRAEIAATGQTEDDFRRWQWSIRELADAQAELPSYRLVRAGSQAAAQQVLDLVGEEVGRELTADEVDALEESIARQLGRAVDATRDIGVAPLPESMAGSYNARALKADERLAAWRGVDADVVAILLQLDRELVALVGEPPGASSYIDPDAVPW